MNTESLPNDKFLDMDEIEMDELLERTKVRIQRHLAEAASARADQASIQAEIRRREWGN